MAKVVNAGGINLPGQCNANHIGSSPIIVAMEEKIEKIWDDMFTNYISPSKFEKLFEKGWYFHETWRGTIQKIPTREFIKKSLEDGLEVKSGWMATSIKDAHNYYILTRQK